MFADLDETIKKLLDKELHDDLSDVDVSFDAPDREWSGRLLEHFRRDLIPSARSFLR